MPPFKESDYSRGIETLEFQTNLGFLVILLNAFYFVQSVFFWQIALAIASASYIVSRGIFKKNRLSIFTRGIKTSEFKVYLATQILLILSCWKLDPLVIGSGLVCMAVVQAALNICRGHTKSFTVKPQILNMGL